MSVGLDPERPVPSALPVADLSGVDEALAGRGDLKAALERVRPADLGRDLSRRSLADARRLLETMDDRRAATVLRAAHPAVAADLIARCDAAHVGRLLAFM